MAIRMPITSITFSAVDRFRLKIWSCRDAGGGLFFGLRRLYVFAILLENSCKYAFLIDQTSISQIKWPCVNV